jgi:hypothetical protein
MTEKKDVYPIEILPKSCYKKRLNVDKLIKKYNSLLVVRLVEGKEGDYLKTTIEGEKEFDDKVFGCNMANLSMNLAGGKFNTSKDAHLRFLPTSEYGKAMWDGVSVRKEEFTSPDNYAIHEPCFGLVFYVGDIHEKAFPFHKQFKTQDERDKYEKKVIDATSKKEKQYDAHLVGKFEEKNKNVSVKPRIKVHHSPTNGNYWHMTLDTYRPSDKNYVTPDEKKSSWDRNMFKALKQHLIQASKGEKNLDYHISSHFYIRWPYLFIPLCVKID